jgi:cobalt-precorrin-5B (C1)-methyltransferase
MKPSLFDGLLVIDKPAGLTSREAVNRAQGWFPRRTRLGHTGTLDPLASGVLVLAVGQATRLAEYVQRMDKTYRTSIRLGATSDTHDAEGTITPRDTDGPPERGQVEDVLRAFVGQIEQVPPEYSAAKLSGRRAYDLARKGSEVVLAPRPVQVHAIEIIRYDYPILELEVRCGKGTYIRSLARDIGARLGCGGYVQALRRTRVGPFCVEGAEELRIADCGLRIEASRLLPLSAAVSDLPSLVLGQEEIAYLRQGRTVVAAEAAQPPHPGPPPQGGRETKEGDIAIFDERQTLVGLARFDPAREVLRPVKMLFLTDCGLERHTSSIRNPQSAIRNREGARESQRLAQQLVRGHTVAPRNPQGRREGFTTGTAAAAAAKAACMVLFDLGWPETVPVHLPIGRTLEIKINTLEYVPSRRPHSLGEPSGRMAPPPTLTLPHKGGGKTESPSSLTGEGGGREMARCGVVKDAGDDPDVTHGAEIFATVRQVAEPGIHIRGGEGVGVVTRPGLELPVGAPAINPVPLQMIRQAVEETLQIANCKLPIANWETRNGVEVTISVPRGEELARKTFNPRLGIVGGISILGTTGIVKAMSTAAWRASVLQAIDVAAANSIEQIVLSTGGRTERFAQERYPHLRELAFVEMGIFTGACLKRAAQRGVPAVSVCCMIGKLSKIAAGKLQTHVAGNQVDCAFLAGIARELQAPEKLAAAIGQANTARHVQELIEAAGLARFYGRLCEIAARQCSAAVSGKLSVEVVLFDFDGRLLGQASA